MGRRWRPHPSPMAVPPLTTRRAARTSALRSIFSEHPKPTVSLLPQLMGRHDQGTMKCKAQQTDRHRGAHAAVAVKPGGRSARRDEPRIPSHACCCTMVCTVIYKPDMVMDVCSKGRKQVLYTADRSARLPRAPADSSPPPHWPSAAADRGDDRHFIAALQRLLLPWCQVLLVQAEHKAAAQLLQLRVLRTGGVGRQGSEGALGPSQAAGACRNRNETRLTDLRCLCMYKLHLRSAPLSLAGASQEQQSQRPPTPT